MKLKETFVVITSGFGSSQPRSQLLQERLSKSHVSAMLIGRI